MLSEAVWTPPNRALLPVVFVLLTAPAACRHPGVEVVFYKADGFTFTSSQRALIRSIAEETVPEVRRALRHVPAQVVVRVNAQDLGPGSGCEGTPSVPAAVYWTVDPHARKSLEQIARDCLRVSLFHEIHHLVRERALGAPRTMMERVVYEGLADAFERDVAHGDVPWAVYPPDVLMLYRGVRDIGDGPPFAFNGNVGHQVGTFLADRALKVGGRSAADLAEVPTAQVLALANVH